MIPTTKQFVKYLISSHRIFISWHYFSILMVQRYIDTTNSIFALLC